MPKKYDVIDELIKDELREFLLWLQDEKEIKLCNSEDRYVVEGYGFLNEYHPIHKAPEDLINEYMEAE